MKIKILFDKAALDSGFLTGWGFSCLIDDKTLFDTGEEGSSLLSNIKNLKIDINKIDSIVISHDHWDHTGGLWDVLSQNLGIKVFACPKFSNGFKEKVFKLKGSLIENSGFKSISKDIFVTGEISGEYAGAYMPEQALIVKTDKGISVVTGCAHPGIVKILEKVKENLPEEKIYLVIGGFHLMDKDSRFIKSIIERFQGLEVQNVAPTHCSGIEAEEIFKAAYRDHFISVKSGQTIEV